MRTVSGSTSCACTWTWSPARCGSRAPATPSVTGFAAWPSTTSNVHWSSRPNPEPIHHALLRDHTPPARLAAELDISPAHMRQVLRHHPLPRPRRPIRRTLIPHAAPTSPPPGQQPGVLYLDPAWLRKEYLTWQRSIDGIAAEIGCPIHALNRFAREHGTPSAPAAAPCSSPPQRHPARTPETCPNRSALPSPAATRGHA